MAEQFNVNELKPGFSFLKDNDVYLVLEASHSKSGRGQAHVKCKAKNLTNNSINIITFTGGERVEKAFIKNQKMQFLYTDSGKAIFMNNESFEQIEIDLKLINNELKYIKEGADATIMSYNGQFLGIELAKNVELVVTSTVDAVKGDTVTNATKKATLETGIEVDVPQFIDEGQKIIINTTTGKYGGKA